MDRNEKLVFEYLDNDELRADIHRIYAALALARSRVAYQEHCPIGELRAAEESQFLEFKSTLRTRADGGEVYKPLETACLKTVAAFANSREGGTLLVGVTDGGGVHGLDNDYASLRKPGKDDRDVFLLHLAQVMINAFGETIASTVSTNIHTVEGHDLCRIHVPPAGFPVHANVIVDTGGQMQKKSAYFVRIGNGTREITDAIELQRYVATRWGGSNAPTSSTDPE